MSGYRVSIKRNVHFVDGNNNEIGGAWQNGALTWSEMVEWMEITFEKPTYEYAPFRCLEPGDPVQLLAQHGPAIKIQGNNNPVKPGFYIILSPEGEVVDLPINRQNPMPRPSCRVSSAELDNHTKHFRNRVRARDGRCVITGAKPAGSDFVRLGATHIFPLAHLDAWKVESWQRQIADDKYVGESGINSAQNGILLRFDVQDLFDTYRIAINPDKGYKTYCFIDEPELDNLIMFPDPNTATQYQPRGDLLKHHFRISVLHNMKGRDGYPKWDEDIPSGCDEMAEAASSEEGKLRLEAILGS
ncbi:hypothetical protein VE04_00574 [Pseudogymnoascus sp. 24MN13]|nr:hypothetical protein VE04_00574 [Pseudogymnoascus sp. 24MN13]